MWSMGITIHSRSELLGNRCDCEADNRVRSTNIPNGFVVTVNKLN